MENLIRVQCESCGVRINAKPELAGQTRKCPKCGRPLKIPAAPAPAENPVPASAPAAGENAAAPATPDSAVGAPEDVAAGAQPPVAPSSADASTSAAVEASPPAPAEEAHGPLPRRLNRKHRYFVVDKTRVVAHWDSNGNGWMVRGPAGFVSAARARDALAVHGEFRLVELKLVPSEQGRQLVGLAIYKLVTRWPLANLDKGDDKVCESIAGRSGLTREQKMAMRQGLRELVSRSIWSEAQQVLDYLGGADSHSTVIG